MRLTLRTLLAYLDNILDPADADLLGKKIEDSEFATSLVRQIRGSVRRLRLDAPALDAQGVGGDLNSVAEYLDNVLPPEEVPALEKACLDNEVNLGEVASCHQVLTLVLGEAAPVTEAMRQRTYGIAPTVAASATPTVDVHSAHDGVPAPSSNMVVSSPTHPVVSDATIPVNLPPVESARQSSSITSPEKDARPSKRYVRIDQPSTKETWRAESTSLETEQQAKSEYAVGVPVAAVRKTTATEMPTKVRPANRGTHSDYMPRRSSWLRSAILTSIVALLIVVSLLFATGSLRENLLTRWLGKRQDVVVNTPRQEASSPPTPVVPVASNDSNLEIVSPNQQRPPSFLENSLVEPAFNNDPSLSEPVPPAPELMPIEPVSIIPLESQAAETFEQPDESLPDLLDSNGFRNPIELPPATEEPILPELNVVEANTSVPRTADPAPVPLFDNATADELMLEEPQITVTHAEIERATEEESVPDLSFDSNLEVASSLSLDEELVTNDFQPAVETLGDASIADAVPSQFDETPIVVVELEPAPVEPPVAAPGPAVSDLAIATRLPIEPEAAIVPEANVAPAMKPRKLRRDDQLLLLFDDDSKAWVRVDSKVQLQEKDYLLGLPAFKSDIEIGSGMVCTVHGVGRVRLGPSTDISLLDGQIVLRSEDDGQSQCVRFQGERLEFQDMDRDTSVAIEAFHRHVPGSDTAELPHSILMVHAMNRPVVVEFRGDTYDIPLGRHLLAVDNLTPRIKSTTKKPKWMYPDSRRQADRGAIREWKKELAAVTNIQSWLHAKAERKIRVGQRALAARSLAEMDDFVATVASLGDPDQRAYWNDQFETMQRALTRGSESRRLLRMELEKSYGSEQSELMMSMLQGYNQKQLASGDAALLVRHLEHPNLELRVLAIENLRRITGRTSDFRPAATLGKRNAKAKAWRKQLEAGRVTYGRNIPEIVQMLESFAEDTQ